MKRIGYARTSTSDQVAGIEKQLADLQAYGCNAIYSEHVSAVADERIEFQKAINSLSEGDTLCVTTMSRLVRRTSDLHAVQQLLEERAAGLEILDLKLDTSTAIGRMTLNIIASVSQMERELLLERQTVGIAKAKADGKYKGRAVTATTDSNKHRLQDLLSKGVSMNDAAKVVGISKASAYRVLKG